MDLKSAARRSYDKVSNELREISKWLYENPELGHREHNSSQRLVDLLTAGGFDVTYPAWGLATAFDAVVGDGEHEVVICAEYDALPEIGHACGHNIIAAAGCGAGLALAPLAAELGIRIRVLGTPAEEAFGGKVDMIEAGAFATADAAMMVHPSSRNEVDAGFLAVKHFDVNFHGKETHAGSSPELGVNALDAAVQAYVNVSTLRQTLLPTDRVHGIITNGGEAPNITPDFTSMAWYVRSLELERLNELLPKVDACFAAAALATGCTHEVVEHGHIYEDMVVDPVMADLYAANSAALGREMQWQRGGPPRGGSTDMGNVSKVVPSIHPMLDINSLPAVNHQRDFAAATVLEYGERAIDDGALAMAWTVIDLAAGDRWSELGAG